MGEAWGGSSVGEGWAWVDEVSVEVEACRQAGLGEEAYRQA